MGESASINKQKKLDNYKPSAIPRTLRFLKDENYGADEAPAKEFAYRTVRVSEMTLVGLPLTDPFPGFDQKEHYLAEGWQKLKSLLEGKLLTEKPAAYFVYHGSEAGLSLCVRMDDLKGIPDGLVQVPVPGREFAVVTYNGLFSDQEQIFMNICEADFEMDPDAIRFEQYDEMPLPSETGEYEFKLYFPMADDRNSDGFKPRSVPNALTLLRGDHKEDPMKDDGRMIETAPATKERAVGMHIINFAVGSMEKSFEFYVDRLGFEKTGSREIRITKSTKIWLHPLDNLEHKPNDISMHWFEIGTKNIKRFHEQLKAAGVPVSDRYDNPGCGRYFDVYDPDGRKITVCQDWYDRFEE